MQRFSDQMHKTAKPGWRWCPMKLKYLRRGNETGARAKLADQAEQRAEFAAQTRRKRALVVHDEEQQAKLAKLRAAER